MVSYRNFNCLEVRLRLGYGSLINATVFYVKAEEVHKVTNVYRRKLISFAVKRFI